MRPAAVIGISALFASGAYAQGGAYAQVSAFYCWRDGPINGWI